MTPDEIDRMWAVVRTADGNCENCVRDLVKLLEKEFPEGAWWARFSNAFPPPAPRTGPGLALTPGMLDRLGDSLQESYRKALDRGTALHTELEKWGKP